ncbi:hypothetical protein NDU88_003924 [Pleurodeles waltl]|uniref:Uncharacterized protein n=1 Tax=Pleurodeles waltl TaxID=8319 RepID=A0AAV7MS54_PLEWA|nr:hypothetical protein NDU88_003924 [Pleurodeles waltl]
MAKRCGAGGNTNRIPATPPPPEAYPRPITVRLMNFRDRDVILQGARKRGPLKIEGKEINIYPDYTNLVQKQRSAFASVKKVLRQNDMKYALLYPAKLRIEYEKRTHFLTSPREAWEWMETHGHHHGNRSIEDDNTKSTMRKKNRRVSRARRRSAATLTQIKAAQMKGLQDLRRKNGTLTNGRWNELASDAGGERYRTVGFGNGIGGVTASLGDPNDGGSVGLTHKLSSNNL